jgi:hypothetical protein
MSLKNTPKNTIKFNCDKCDFVCVKKSEWERHVETKKHVNNENLELINKINIKNAKNAEIEYYACEICNKFYKCRTGLWRHHKKYINNTCLNHKKNTIITDTSNNEIVILSNMVLELVKSNNDLQKQMIEVCQKIQPGNTVINSNNNSNNKTFNLQLFLNEECKDAMNMSDFINSIELKISDLENIGKLGYVEGMSSIIIRELNDTDMYKRPVHCSDAKRETMYVREENKWERDNSETKQMVKAVRGVDKKNYKLLTSWKEMDPKCVDSKSNQCDKYMKIMSKVMDGDIENVHKVIKKVAKEVVIDKSIM